LDNAPLGIAFGVIALVRTEPNRHLHHQLLERGSIVKWNNWMNWQWMVGLSTFIVLGAIFLEIAGRRIPGFTSHIDTPIVVAFLGVWGVREGLKKRKQSSSTSK
jgi:hypothetical protein